MIVGNKKIDNKGVVIMPFEKIDHKQLLADSIAKSYRDYCSSVACGECKYAFKENCHILFTLDLLEWAKERAEENGEVNEEE